MSKEFNYSSLKIKNIDEAVKLLFSHLARQNGHIFMIVDADFDGFASAAILLNYIYRAVPTAVSQFSYAFHDGKAHGIVLEQVPENTTLVIALDSSSNDYAIHEELHNRGVDVLVVDHHKAPKESEFACVVNNQLCDYPNKSLCGAGMTYKFCQRIDELAGFNFADDFLDLVGAANVGDMMDLRSMETHYLVQESLKCFRNPFLRAMRDRNEYSIGDEITPMGIAFYIVPLVNAITRVGNYHDNKLVFESMLEWLAYEEIPSTKRGCQGKTETRVEQAVRVCTNVKNAQTRLQDSGVEVIERLVDNVIHQHKLLLLRCNAQDVNPNIRGLLANKIMAKYHRPVAILTRTNLDGQDVWAGSARGYDKSSIKDFRSFCLRSPLVVQAAGHPNAFGLAIKAEFFEEFVSWCDDQLIDEDFSASYLVDFINPPPQTISALGNHKDLWGQNLAEPLVVLENVRVNKNNLFLMSRDKHPTLKIELPNGISCIKFKSSEEEFNDLYPGLGCVTLTLVGKPSVNKYLNKITPQVLVEDYEIISRKEYYF